MRTDKKTFKKALQIIYEKAKDCDCDFCVFLDEWGKDLKVNNYTRLHDLYMDLLDFLHGFNVTINANDTWNDSCYSRNCLSSCYVSIDDSDLSLCVNFSAASEFERQVFLFALIKFIVS